MTVTRSDRPLPAAVRGGRVGDCVVAFGTVLASQTLDGPPLTGHGRVRETPSALELAA